MADEMRDLMVFGTNDLGAARQSLSRTMERMVNLSEEAQADVAHNVVWGLLVAAQTMLAKADEAFGDYVGTGNSDA